MFIDKGRACSILNVFCTIIPRWNKCLLQYLQHKMLALSWIKHSWISLSMKRHQCTFIHFIPKIFASDIWASPFKHLSLEWNDLHNLQCTSNIDVSILYVRNVLAVSMGKTQRQAWISLSTIVWWLNVNRYLLTWAFVSHCSRRHSWNSICLLLPLRMRDRFL